MLTVRAPHALVTGGAGFIGSHVVDRLLHEGWRVTVIDSMDPFYPRSMKEANITAHRGHSRYSMIEGDILDPDTLDGAFDRSDPFDVLIHLAAKAGVRPSISDPVGYHRVNVTGTLMLLEIAKHRRVPHFILASSSSVYGEDPDVPWRETADVSRPISPYAATKVMAEHYARLYAALHGMKVTTLRFFTVYGPRQRPDLAIHKFTRAILHGDVIEQFGDGSTRRDYTYVDDIVEGVMGAVRRTSGGNHEVYNLGNSRTVALRELIAVLEEGIGRRAIIRHMPEQPGDVPQTFAHTLKAGRDLGFAPRTELREGLARFQHWYLEARERRAGLDAGRNS